MAVWTPSSTTSAGLIRQRDPEQPRYGNDESNGATAMKDEVKGRDTATLDSPDRRKLLLGGAAGLAAAPFLGRFRNAEAAPTQAPELGAATVRAYGAKRTVELSRINLELRDANDLGLRLRRTPKLDPVRSRGLLAAATCDSEHEQQPAHARHHDRHTRFRPQARVFKRCIHGMVPGETLLGERPRAGSAVRSSPPPRTPTRRPH
jgi:hypothetical protein